MPARPGTVGRSRYRSTFERETRRWRSLLQNIACAVREPWDPALHVDPLAGTAAVGRILQSAIGVAPSQQGGRYSYSYSYHFDWGLPEDSLGVVCVVVLFLIYTEKIHSETET